MPKYEFLCPNDGVFDKLFSFTDDMPDSLPCPQCTTKAHRILSLIGAAYIQGGGTGAGRGNKSSRKQLAWDNKANELQHDPYTQAKAQLTNVYNASRDLGQECPKPTEESVQVAAAQIAKQPRSERKN